MFFAGLHPWEGRHLENSEFGIYFGNLSSGIYCDMLGDLQRMVCHPSFDWLGMPWFGLYTVGEIFSMFFTPGKLSAVRRPVANWQNSTPHTATTTNPPPSAKFVLRVSFSDSLIYRSICSKTNIKRPINQSMFIYQYNYSNIRILLHARPLPPTHRQVPSLSSKFSSLIFWPKIQFLEIYMLQLIWIFS